MIGGIKCEVGMLCQPFVEQPIWSQPRVKVAAFGDALGHAKNRIKSIAAELGLKVPANLAS